MPFELSGGFRPIPRHLGTRDFSRTSCQNTDLHLRVNWPRGLQNSNRSLPRIVATQKFRRALWLPEVDVPATAGAGASKSVRLCARPDGTDPMEPASITDM